MRGSNNNPPWILDAKKKYLSYDVIRAQTYFRKVGGQLYGNGPQWKTPSFFPLLTLLVRDPIFTIPNPNPNFSRKPQQILTYIKQSYPQHIYEQTFLSFFHHIWSASPQLDISKEENVIYALQHTYTDDQRNKPAFTQEEIHSILQESSSEVVKDQLKETTSYRS